MASPAAKRRLVTQGGTSYLLSQCTDEMMCQSSRLPHKHHHQEWKQLHHMTAQHKIKNMPTHKVHLRSTPTQTVMHQTLKYFITAFPKPPHSQSPSH
ncbi:uncharacterized protein BDR25DRAFT_348831 [Lindgomyces ingoldianus]|uniref:Uncharacterized protein n=1 Tax=Lindgomyces ingoldianus TaxID=673940 RepID=A0ACB6REJ4_9PLEO|nr:uncharacterized protein BDR25DRAFT_348831 [Lindgomyces ingoldianus]KAF2476901.1 hypothetical protein BDR25DRAFT_348831 [Lindgomyces ingoldianus]